MLPLATRQHPFPTNPTTRPFPLERGRHLKDGDAWCYDGIATEIQKLKLQLIKNNSINIIFFFIDLLVEENWESEYW